MSIQGIHHLKWKRPARDLRIESASLPEFDCTNRLGPMPLGSHHNGHFVGVVSVGIIDSINQNNVYHRGPQFTSRP